MHGFLHSASEFVNLGPGKALSLLLSDEGYDVWLGNARGTTWSRKHQTLDPDTDPVYWNFTMHEIGIYDVPALVDYILNETKVEKLHYVGYSQGSLVFFIGLSQKPELAKKIQLMSALAPAVFLKDARSPLLMLMTFIRALIEWSVWMFNLGEIFSKGGVTAAYLERICDENSMLAYFCLQHFYIVHGIGEMVFDKVKPSNNHILLTIIVFLIDVAVFDFNKSTVRSLS